MPTPSSGCSKIAPATHRQQLAGWRGLGWVVDHDFSLAVKYSENVANTPPQWSMCRSESPRAFVGNLGYIRREKVPYIMALETAFKAKSKQIGMMYRPVRFMLWQTPPCFHAHRRLTVSACRYPDPLLPLCRGIFLKLRIFSRPPLGQCNVHWKAPSTSFLSCVCVKGS